MNMLPAAPTANARQQDASRRSYSALAVSTDPPYYDNIGYSDLSDFFYVWLRRSLGSIQSKTVATMLSPKSDELVANPYRHSGREGAEAFFVSGFNSVFRRIRQSANPAVPLTVYYAYKQQDVGEDGAASTGWHTLLGGLDGAGWEVTATWPVRSERGGRMRDVGSNALASSIVLACRPRPQDASAITARRFLDLLRLELPGALRAMIRSDIAPVDLAQAAIGPGMSIFSRYSRVREADGSDMSVRDALLLINQTLDEVIDEQEADFDPDTRFAVKWYRQYAWGVESSGIADQLSRSTDTSVGALERGGIFEAKGGKARLLSPKELTGEWDVEKDERVSIWEALVRLAAVMEKQGADQVAALLPAVGSKVSLDNVKELGVMLFHYAEKKGDAQDGLLFNGLVTAWSDVTSQARRLATAAPRVEQPTLDFEQGES
jgi:putative DNA methylase